MMHSFLFFFVNSYSKSTLVASPENNVTNAISETDHHQDWWDEIGDGERAAIETGLKQMKSGKTTPHEEVMEKYRKWLSR